MNRFHFEIVPAGSNVPRRVSVQAFGLDMAIKELSWFCLDNNINDFKILYTKEDDGSWWPFIQE